MERVAASRWTGRAVLPVTRVARRPARSRYTQLSNAYATAETEWRRGNNRRNARDCTDLRSKRAPDQTRAPFPIGSQISVIRRSTQTSLFESAGREPGVGRGILVETPLRPAKRAEPGVSRDVSV